MRKLLVFCLLIFVLIGGCGGGGSNSSAIGTSGTGSGITPPGGTTAVGIPQSISFVVATPANIGLKGMGGAGIQETSVVKFRVLDTNKIGIANVTVDFTLNTTVGGLSLVTSSGVTASDGSVSTTVQAGTISTSVKVTASVRGTSPLIFTQSDQLVVATGVAAQDGFSISISTLNVEAWNTDGVVDLVTARLSDHFHNPVPDGTAVYFTTSGGSIQPSCTTVNGACSVNWTSQNPRPTLLAGAKNNGRAVIFAYSVGEESFVDSNGNGVADSGEFTDTTGAFRDDNENGVLDSTEPFIPFNQTGVFDQKDGRYNGVLQNAADIAAGAPRSKHVFSNSVIVMSSSSPGTVLFTTSSVNVATQTGPSTTVIGLTVSDVNGNVMPAGTVISVAGVGGTLSSSFTTTIPNTTSTGSGLTLFGVPVINSSTTGGSDALKVTVTVPSGLSTIITLPITY